MITKIIKRDGREVPFNIEKITNAIYKAAQAIGGKDYNTALKLSEMVADRLDETYKGQVPTVEQVQDCVEKVLVETGHARTAKEYILYRAQRTRVREMNTRLMKIYERLTFKDAQETPRFGASGTLYRYGQEGAKQFYEMFVIDPNHVRAVDSGNYEIHAPEAYGLTTQSCQIDLSRLFSGGFSSGGVAIREPMDVSSALALAALALQMNQNDQHGPQGIPNFDFAIAHAVRKTYRRLFRQELTKASELCSDHETALTVSDLVLQVEQNTGSFAQIELPVAYFNALKAKLCEIFESDSAAKLIEHARTHAFAQCDRALYQGIEGFLSALNTVSTRGGFDVPDTAIQYGTDLSPEGRLVSKNLLLATDRGLGNGQEAVYPKQYFKCKNRINTRADDPNHDLYELACEIAAKGRTIRFIFLDAPCNARYYQTGKPETEAAYFSDGSRILENRCAGEDASVLGRGTLSTTYLNLPRIAIRAQKNQDVFFDELDRKLDHIFDQLLERLKLQGDKSAQEFPFLMQNGVWLGSDALLSSDKIAGVLKNGVLAVGFVGLTEALVSLCGAHHGENPDAQSLGLEIVAHMRRRCDRFSEKQNLNFVLTGVEEPDAARRFAETDRELYGEIPGVTDHGTYSGAFSLPVDAAVTLSERISIEAPYHELTNGGHLTQVFCKPEHVRKLLEEMRVSGIACGAVLIQKPSDKEQVTL